jgi:hypothetical protein
MKMKQSVWFMTALMVFISITVCKNEVNAQKSIINDSVIMGAGYTNEIYYSMANGPVLTSPRNTWDIAFRTRILSSSILINDGKSVVLYTYPKSDTAGWNSVDTTGLFEWTPMYNDPNDWENGAFSRNATGGFDFGWGIYDQGTHYLTGDSLFVIKLRDGSFRKLWIQQKKSGENIYYFRYADIDGLNEFNDTLNCKTYTSRDFIGFSMTTNDVVDFQAEKLTWDILFTKYMSVQPNGEPYPVTGVVENDGVIAQKYKHVTTFFTGYNPYTWDSTRSVIGYDWKSFDGTAYVIVDSLVCFVKNKPGEVYKLVFTGFEGSSTGKITFWKTKLSGVGINEKHDNTADVQVYPNPLRDKMTVYFLESSSQVRKLTLKDLSGRTVMQQNVSGSESRWSMEMTSLNPGIYLLQVTSGDQSVIKKVIISR